MKTSHRVAGRILWSLSIATAFYSCGDSGPAEPDPVSSVSVAPNTATLVTVDETVQLEARLFIADDLLLVQTSRQGGSPAREEHWPRVSIRL